MSDTKQFLSFRTMVSRVYRLSMLLASKRHSAAADQFDLFMEDAAQLFDTSSSREIQTLNEFLERDPLEEKEEEIKGIRLVIHELPESQEVRVVKVDDTGMTVTIENNLCSNTVVTRVGDSDVVDNEVEIEDAAEEAEAAEEEVDAAEEEVDAAEEETEDAAAEEEAEAADEETEAADEETEAADEETEVAAEAEEETEAAAEEEAEAADEETEVAAEETEVAAEAEEEAEVAAEEAEAAEESEVAAEEAEAEEESEVAAEEAEAAEAEEEAEAAEEAEETEAVEDVEAEEEAEEGGLEPIKIGKTMYFIDTATNNVFAYVSDEEAGDYVGKVVNGKLVRE
jgi:hypothetical protein